MALIRAGGGGYFVLTNFGFNITLFVCLFFQMNKNCNSLKCSEWENYNARSFRINPNLCACLLHIRSVFFAFNAITKSSVLLSHKRVILFRPQLCDRVGISLTKVYEKIGKFCHCHFGL